MTDTPEPTPETTESPEELTVEQAVEQIEQVGRANATRIADLQQLGHQLDPLAVLNQKIESLMSVMIPPEARVFVDLHFHRAMQEHLEQALSQARQQALLAPGPVPRFDPKARRG